MAVHDGRVKGGYRAARRGPANHWSKIKRGESQWGGRQVSEGSSAGAGELGCR